MEMGTHYDEIMLEIFQSARDEDTDGTGWRRTHSYKADGYNVEVWRSDHNHLSVSVYGGDQTKAAPVAIAEFNKHDQP